MAYNREGEGGMRSIYTNSRSSPCVLAISMRYVCWKLHAALACSTLLLGCSANVPVDPAGQLEGLGATLRRDPAGRVVAVRFRVKSIVDDEALRHVASLRYISSLDLDRTPITDAGLLHLRQLSRLRELRLRGTRVTVTGLTHLRGLRKLEDLQLASCGMVTDAAVPALQHLTSLRKLAIRGTRLTPGGLRTLRERMPDCEIY